MYQGKTVLITGGAGGIGKACVLEFLKSGAKVLIVDFDEYAVEKCIAQFSNDNHIFGYAFDLNKVRDIPNFISQISQEHQHIDILVQAAGMMSSRSALDVEVDEFEKIMKINVEGMFFMMQEVVKQFMFDNGGSILNFASEAAIRGFTGSMAGVHYSASKGAVIAMSRQLAVEWGQYQIRVNSICPGGVLTSTMEKMSFDEDFQMIPLKRLSTPKDIAKTVAYLCSDGASMITGQNIVVDGGCAAVGC